MPAAPARRVPRRTACPLCSRAGELADLAGALAGVLAAVLDQWRAGLGPDPAVEEVARRMIEEAGRVAGAKNGEGLCD